MKSEQWKPRTRFERLYESILGNVWQKSRHIGSAEFLWNYAKQAAARLITGLYVENAKTWREAARESGKTSLMYRALQAEMNGEVGTRFNELIRENAKLIRSFPSSVARRAVASGAAAQQQAGGRANEFRAELNGLARSQAQRLARTEISKASTALTQARSESLGVDWYLWQTSEDVRVRFSHKKLQGVLVNFADPPAPEHLVGIKSTLGHYNAGNAPNDRCYAAPVVRPETLKWPRRVYHAGSIRVMTLANFRLINTAGRMMA